VFYQSRNQPKIGADVIRAIASDLGVDQLNTVEGRNINLNAGTVATVPQWISPPWFLTRTPESIDLEYKHAPKDHFSFSDFAKRATTVLARVAEDGNGKAKRMACIEEGLITRLDPEALEALGSRLINPPAALANPFEWDWRAATRREIQLEGGREALNVVVTLKRVQGQINTLDFDGIYVQSDCNTSGANAVDRFSKQGVEEFFAESSTWFSELGLGVTQLMGDA
tara:strand:+ start:9706 stop:10383 length:678 start_codon:yes stop_codon:yes gene_type:complete